MSKYTDNVILDVTMIHGNGLSDCAMPCIYNIDTGKLLGIHKFEEDDYNLDEFIIENKTIEGIIPIRSGKLLNRKNYLFDNNRIIQYKKHRGLVPVGEGSITTTLVIDLDNAVLTLNEIDKKCVKVCVKHKELEYSALTREFATQLEKFMQSSKAENITFHELGITRSELNKYLVLGCAVAKVHSGVNDMTVETSLSCLNSRNKLFFAADIVLVNFNNTIHVYSNKPMKPCALYQGVFGHTGIRYCTYTLKKVNTLKIIGMDMSTIQRIDGIFLDLDINNLILDNVEILNASAEQLNDYIDTNNIEITNSTIVIKNREPDAASLEQKADIKAMIKHLTGATDVKINNSIVDITLP